MSAPEIKTADGSSDNKYIKMSAAEIKSIDDKITADGSSGYKAEKGRYHLYVQHGCPYAHRATVYVALKGLEEVISQDNVDPVTDGVNGWQFTPEKKGCTADTLNGKKYLKEVYAMSHPNYTGRITVPVLFDKQTQKIVSNESASIIRMFNQEFNEFSATKEQASLDLYPEEKRAEIDTCNDWLTKEILTRPYKAIGYKSAVGSTQEEYEEQVTKLFEALDKAEDMLSTQRYINGDNLTESDILFFVFLVRFDYIFYSLLKCNKKMVSQYYCMWDYVRDLYQTSNIKGTVKVQQIKEISWSNKKVNTSRIIPLGPDLDFGKRHFRDNFKDDCYF